MLKTSQTTRKRTTATVRRRASIHGTARTSQTMSKKTTTPRTTKQQPPQVGTLLAFFMNEMHDLYSAENQILDMLPKMIKAANSSDLKQALKDHMKETQEQVKRLDRAFRLLNQTPRKQTCEGMEGIISEGEKYLTGHSKPLTRDVAIIAAAQRVEHYEIATYGTARAHARQLDLDQIADLLDETLDEESAADKKLSKIAEGTIFSTGVNQLAAEEAYAHA